MIFYLRTVFFPTLQLSAHFIGLRYKLVQRTFFAKKLHNFKFNEEDNQNFLIFETCHFFEILGSHGDIFSVMLHRLSNTSFYSFSYLRKFCTLIYLKYIYYNLDTKSKTKKLFYTKKFQKK